MQAVMGGPRIRTRPIAYTGPKQPTSWPAGSCVFMQGTTPRMGTGIAENQPGFMGRVTRDAKTSEFAAWKWRQTVYVHIGNFSAFNLACNALA